MTPPADQFKRAPARWRRQLAVFMRRQGVMSFVELATLVAALAIGAATYFYIAGTSAPERFLTPPIVALLLVVNLVPVTALLVLLARRIAKGRAARSPAGGRGRLHVRLVALFSVIATVPTLLVVVFASLLFQYGVEFWFSDRARTVLDSADRVAQAYVNENKQRIVADVLAMAGDVNGYAGAFGIDTPRFAEGLAWQVAARNLSEAAVIAVGKDGDRKLIAGANLDARPLAQRLPTVAINELRFGKARVVADAGDRVETVVRLDPQADIYLYASRDADPVVLATVAKARSALSDYGSMVERSRSLQLQFNAALLLVSLLIVAAVIWIALRLADRLVRPIGELVEAARRVAAGDLTPRVTSPLRDEIGTLANAFNRMTRKLGEQTGTLESRRAFTEAVLSGVSAGVLSIDEERCITLINSSAEELLKTGGESPVGRTLAEVAPELDRLIGEGEREAVIQLAVDGDPRTLAVKLVRAQRGLVLTFDDITQQLADQRRAAWADVARRIAHEIKNPLTPIQLAAERLQRRYGQEVSSDRGTFERLTATIVRQVGDLRRMVDEFSSFARLPKPVFREEAIVDLARQVLFLHEVAHPNIAFRFAAPDPSPLVVCDRRQLSQALTNLVKNAVEAIGQKPHAEGERHGTIGLSISRRDGRLTIEIADDGVGLPAERERLTEPYMTTRARGTGLGLAIVKKIVEDHFGSMSFADRAGGGAVVRIVLDPAILAPLAGSGEGETTNRDARPAELTRVRSG